MARSDASVPIVLPCHGVSAHGVAAAEVAAQLAERGLAEIVDDIEEIVTAARGGRPVIALDGCAGSCQVRLLDARGVPTLRALNLDDATENQQALAETTTIDQLESATTLAPRSRRVANLAAAELGSKRTHSIDDYVLALDILTSPVVECGAVSDSPTLAAHVASLLGVSRPTAGQMLARLEQDGLIRRGEHKNVLFTPAGRREADRLVRKQRILECFATETLGYRLDECYEQARQMAPGFDDATLERTWIALGTPDRCPHGWPIDPLLARERSRGLVALSAAPEGSTVVVERVDESSTARLRSLVAFGIVPGRELADVTVSAGAGMVGFSCAGSRQSISTVLGGAALVRAA